MPLSHRKEFNFFTAVFFDGRNKGHTQTPEPLAGKARNTTFHKGLRLFSDIQKSLLTYCFWYENVINVAFVGGVSLD